jgi:hypothetical protein
MRINFFSRSSRATGPKMRVPRGSFVSVISTAALSLNLIGSPYDYRLEHRPFFNLARGKRVFYRNDNNVAYLGVTTPCSAQYSKTLNPLRT